MKLAQIPVYLSLLFAASAAARSFSFPGTQRVLEDQLKDPRAIKGNSSLRYCDYSKSDVLVIEHINLIPNPPEAGQNLTIEAAGVFLKDVEEGAYVLLDVRWNLVRLLHRPVDLCEQVENVDLHCPLKKGETVIRKTMELPKRIPGGTYNVRADVYTKDDEKIVCLTADAYFPPL